MIDMLLIDAPKKRKELSVTQPRPVFCVIEDLYRSPQVANDACRGIFTNAGVTIELGPEIDWLANPLPADEEWQIEWFKFYFGLDLAHAFCNTGDREYLLTWQRLVSSFIEQVPVGFDSADISGRRIQNWIYARQIFARSDHFSGFDKDFNEILLDSLWRQVAHLRKHLTPERNHRTLELYALFIAALALPEIDVDGDLLQFAIDELIKNLLTDVLPDGVHREQSTHYHMIVLRSFLGVKENARRFDLHLPDEFEERLIKACEFAMNVHRPDGGIPALSDSDTGSYLDLLKLAGKLFGRPDFTYVATRGQQGDAPADRHASFQNGGYYVQRSDWGEGETDFANEKFLIFDCGRIGDGGHGHYDLLNIEVSGRGMPLITDPGRFTYSEEGETNWRHYFKGTRAHNTVCIDGTDQTEYRRGKPKNAAEGRFLERQSLAGLDILSGQAKSTNYDAVHTRRIFFIRTQFWLIWDSLRAVETHDYDLRFHLTPAAWDQVRIWDEESNPTVRTHDLALVFEPHCQPSVEPGWYSPTYGIKQQSPCVSVLANDVSSTDLYTLVVPTGVEEVAPQFKVINNKEQTTVEIATAKDSCKTTDLLSWKMRGDYVLVNNFFSKKEAI